MTDHLLTQFRSEVLLPDEATTRRIYLRATSGRHRAPRRRLLLAVALMALAVPAVVFGSALIGSTPSPEWIGQHLEGQFRSDVATAAEQDPEPQFEQASRASIASVLDANSASFGYSVERVEVLPGRDGAPLIVLRVRGDLHTFARLLPTLERTVDPLSGKVDPSTGERRMKYEALFLEAVDGNGVPFLVIWNVWRQPIGGGGQWAREESLFPFAHG
jgi:hypothetical protein